MRICFLFLLVFSLPFALFADFEEPSEAVRAKQAVADFSKALKSELVAAMQSGGATEAIEVCHLRAAVIAEEVSSTTGMKLSRVSGRNRNPSNAPNDWQTAVLQDFEVRKRAGEEAGSLTWYERAETASGTEFRFMKAIPTGGICLQCHGTEIAEPVALKLAELYPEDKATGFRAGDLRGAFVVTAPAD
jgi:hypothetical protein